MLQFLRIIFIYNVYVYFYNQVELGFDIKVIH